MVTIEDAEVFAARELQKSSLDGHDAPPWDLLLARRDVHVAQFGDGSPIRGDGTHGRLKGRPIVYLHERLPPRGRAFVALHEYGHTIIESERLDLDCHVERWCNRFAASILCPPTSVRRAWRDAGANLPAAHALRPALGSTAFALRLGEAGLALVRLFDGDLERYVEPTEWTPPNRLSRLVRAARNDGFAQAEDVRAWRLANVPRRVAVLRAA
jgi:hypothetical protein